MGQLFGIKIWQARLDVSRRQVELMFSRGELPAAIRIGRIRKWTEEQVNEWIEARQQEAEARAGAAGTPGRPRAGAGQ